MSVDNIAFAAPYLTENSATSFPTVGTPSFTETPDDSSEFMSICGFSFQGRSLTGTQDITDVRIKGFGSALGSSTDLPSPSTLTNAMVQGYSRDNNGLVRFILSKPDGTEIIDTADSDTSNLFQEHGWRKEEVLRGDYIHGFVQQDKYFLTYIINYPVFYEFFGPVQELGTPSGGHYSSFTDRMADYYTGTDQLAKTQLVPNTLSPHANSVDSFITLDIYAGTGEDDYPAVSSADYDSTSGELETLYTSPTTDYQHIAFCLNDAAGVHNLGAGHMPTYISGTLSCPWDPDYLSGTFDKDVVFTEGFNIELVVDGADISFSAVAGKGVGFGPDCTPDTDQPLRRLGGATPDDTGEIYIGAEKCIMVSPDTENSTPAGETPIDSYLVCGQHPDETSSSYNPRLVISGFCAQCCPCNNYENVYKALLNTGSYLWESVNPPHGTTGLLAKIEKTVGYYQCLLDQYSAVYDCFANDPVVVSTTGWGHYGYLVSAQVLIQNHGPEDLETSGLTIEFEFDGDDAGLGVVTDVKGTSYANLDEKNVDTDDFNPAQPLDALGVVIESGATSSSIKLSGGFFDGVIIRRGRYMSVGITAYLEDAAKGDSCSISIPYSLKTTVTDLLGLKLADANPYQCQSTLFLATPCTPPIATVAWIDRDSSKIKVKFTGPLLDDSGGHINISLDLSWDTLFHDWVPTSDEANSLDLCGNTIAYVPSIDFSDPAGWPNQSDTPVSTQFTYVDGVYEAPFPDSEFFEFLYTNLTDPINVCSCPSPSCTDCSYPAYAPRLNVTLAYSAAEAIYCEGTSESLILENFEISTTSPAEAGPPIVYYNCDTDCTGTGSCHS